MDNNVSSESAPPDHRDFPRALKALLRSQHEKSEEGVGQQGWAPQHTAALDAAFAPSRALVRVALGLPVGEVSLPVGRMPGRPLYRLIQNYALTRAGLREEGVLEEAREKARASDAIGLFYALTLSAAGIATSAFEETVARQRGSGEFLDASPYDSPDLHWYDELVVLHALASHAAITKNGNFIEPVKRAARFHTAETQPDHATSQPWALHAFALEEECRPLADLLLHGAMAQNVGRLDVISQVLLADAVLALC